MSGVRDTRVVFDRDANRQNIADIAQLIRAIEVGIHVDGEPDGKPDAGGCRQHNYVCLLDL